MNPFEVLAEPIRRRIVEILASGEHIAGDIEAVIMLEFGVGRSAVQHHLRFLRECGWTRGREDWPHRWHRLDDDVIDRLEREVRRLRKRWDRRIGWAGMGRFAHRVPHYAKNRQLRRTKKGMRGLGTDPDDPWQHPEEF